MPYASPSTRARMGTLGEAGQKGQKNHRLREEKEKEREQINVRFGKIVGECFYQLTGGEVGVAFSLEKKIFSSLYT